MTLKIFLPGVKHVLVVASGKGGVGKTTVTVNLAFALQRAGASVGIFDADIYGPNVPLMLGVHRQKTSKGYATLARRKNAPPYIPPLQRYGLKIMSVGLLVAEYEVIDPARSPDAVGNLVVQTLRDVVWGDLDYLLIDLPPSAGQPQAALENMSYFVCPTCGEKHEIFQRSAQWQPPALADAPLLGRIPLTPAISQGINQANPLMHDQPDSPQAEAFRAITTVLRQRLEANP